MASSCTSTTKLSKKDIRLINGNWGSPCISPLPDPGYRDCPLEEGSVEFVVYPETGNGKMVESHLGRVIREVPIKVSKSEDGLELNFVKGKLKDVHYKIIELSATNMTAHYEEKKIAYYWKKKK